LQTGHAQHHIKTQERNTVFEHILFLPRDIGSITL